MEKEKISIFQLAFKEECGCDLIQMPCNLCLLDPFKCWAESKVSLPSAKGLVKQKGQVNKVTNNFPKISDDVREIKRFNRKAQTNCSANRRVRNPTNRYYLPTWYRFNDVQFFVTSSGFSRVGYVLKEGDCYVFIELRKVINAKTRDIKSWAQKIIDHFIRSTEIYHDKTSIFIIKR
jgi:hypothetical protein